jgi:hypothetical protein
VIEAEQDVLDPHQKHVQRARRRVRRRAGHRRRGGVLRWGVGRVRGLRGRLDGPAAPVKDRLRQARPLARAEDVSMAVRQVLEKLDVDLDRGGRGGAGIGHLDDDAVVLDRPRRDESAGARDAVARHCHAPHDRARERLAAPRELRLGERVVPVRVELRGEPGELALGERELGRDRRAVHCVIAAREAHLVCERLRGQGDGQRAARERSHKPPFDAWGLRAGEPRCAPKPPFDAWGLRAGEPRCAPKPPFDAWGLRAGEPRCAPKPPVSGPSSACPHAPATPRLPPRR